MNSQSSDIPKHQILAIKEALAGLVAALILLALAIVVINPFGRIATSQDGVRQHNVDQLAEALKLFNQQSELYLPTHSNGKPLETVTTETLIADGIDASNLDNFAGEFISEVPTLPEGTVYKLGVLSGGTIIVGVELSSGEVYSKQVT